MIICIRYFVTNYLRIRPCGYVCTKFTDKVVKCPLLAIYWHDWLILVFSQKKPGYSITLNKAFSLCTTYIWDNST